MDPHLEPSLVGESHRTLAADPQRGGVESFQKKDHPDPSGVASQKMSDLGWEPKKW